MRRFARVDLGEDTVPDESTILRFRHLFEAHALTAQMFDAVRDLLVDRDLLVTTGTIVDTTLIAAPSSAKHATKTRDPEMRQTRKGKSWYFGMKCRIGTDPHGLVHTLTTTDAAQADISQLPALVHGMEASLHGDKAYWKESDREAYDALGGQYLVNQRGEHLFLVVKTLWGFTKVRYRGLYQNTVRALAALALANLYTGSCFSCHRRHQRRCTPKNYPHRRTGAPVQSFLSVTRYKREACDTRRGASSKWNGVHGPVAQGTPGTRIAVDWRTCPPCNSSGTNGISGSLIMRRSLER